MKRKFLQKLSGLLSVVVLSVTLSSTVLAEENESDVVERNIPILEGIGTIVDGGSIEINGTENALFIEFDDQSLAIVDLKNKVPTLLNEISRIYDLEELSDSNWRKYQESMNLILDSNMNESEYNESSSDVKILRAFFDIYENKSQNEIILSYVNNIKNARALDALEQTENLALLLPYTDPFVEERMINKKNTRASINVSAAISYAERYATEINYSDYDYFSSDCTNFVSQVLENAGVSQVVYNSENSGWWHKVTPGYWGIGDLHQHSISWIRADTFARYMGYSHVTYSNWNFSSNVQTGDFAALDFTRDGSWDHMGFVTNVDNYVGSYGYYDYKIAQHTSNYHDWASHDACGWENVGLEGGNYAIVRR
ncbi:MAG: amidase domain-containing protein [Eubacteriales bacterium]|nr:amidase domain-containing protein [Eubacteriales bacterium]